MGLRSSLRAALLNIGAALLILAVGLQSALRIGLWRRNGGAAIPAEAPVEAPPEAAAGWQERSRQRVERSWIGILRMLRREELLIGVAALLVLWIVRRTWDFTVAGAVLGLPGYVGAG